VLVLRSRCVFADETLQDYANVNATLFKLILAPFCQRLFTAWGMPDSLSITRFWANLFGPITLRVTIKYEVALTITPGHRRPKKL
jgi:hypothetical protein